MRMFVITFTVIEHNVYNASVPANSEKEAKEKWGESPGDFDWDYSDQLACDNLDILRIT